MLSTMKEKIEYLIQVHNPDIHLHPWKEADRRIFIAVLFAAEEKKNR